MEIERFKARRRTLLFETANGWRIKDYSAKRQQLKTVNESLFDLTNDQTYLLG